MADRTILDLTTDTDRPVVAIDGIGYPLRTLRDLTRQDFKYLERVTLRVAALLSTTRTLSKSEDHELEQRLREVAKVAVDAPAAVLAKLAPIQFILIFKVFMELLTPTLIAAARAIEGIDQDAAPPSVGMRPSPVSSGSTAAHRKHGSRARRRESSRHVSG